MLSRSVIFVQIYPSSIESNFLHRFSESFYKTSNPFRRFVVRFSANFLQMQGQESGTQSGSLFCEFVQPWLEHRFRLKNKRSRIIRSVRLIWTYNNKCIKYNKLLYSDLLLILSHTYDIIYYDYSFKQKINMYSYSCKKMFKWSMP